MQLTIHLTILLFWPLALALLGATGPRSWAPGVSIVGTVVPLAYAVMMLFDYDTAAGGLQYVTDDKWIGALVGGASGLVRAASSAVRAGQSGYLRYYAALLLVGLTGLGAYFLISA